MSGSTSLSLSLSLMERHLVVFSAPIKWLHELFVALTSLLPEEMEEQPLAVPEK